MIPAAFIVLLTSGAPSDLGTDLARAVLALAHGSADGALTTLSLHGSGLAIPVRLLATASPLPDAIRSVETFPVAGAVDGAMLVVNGAIGIGLFAGEDAVAVVVNRGA